MYDVSNRESFEALSRWLEELENYVPPEVVKIVVGNKLDEVKSSPLMIIILPPTADARHSCTHVPHPPFRNTLDKCPHQKAQRSQRGWDVYSSRRPLRQLWAFNEVITCIIDMSLWK
jgi:GTPase SAR1 family protein